MPPKKKQNKRYVIIRTFSSGVFAGYLESRTGHEAVLSNARRLWYWNGAASLSQLAVDGVSRPQDCKFPAPVPQVELISPQGLEILDVTEKAKKIIESVPEWKA